MVSTRQTKARVAAASHPQPPQDLNSPVKFYRLVLPSTMERNMMRIPAIFVKVQGSKLSEFVTLETPVGFKRSIKLKRINEEIWFHQGWDDFAEAHSISEGHFLLFEYKGNSSFTVKIFDVSASEIDYPTDLVLISDSDDDVVHVTDEEAFVGTQSVNHKLEKRPKDMDLEKILTDLDAISPVRVREEEEKEDKRVFKGNQFF